MHVLSEVLENELKNAVEVKNEASLHRWINYLVESIPQKEQHENEHSAFREAVIRADAKMDATLTEIHEGFKRMDARFEASDKRFDSMQKQMDERFDSMQKHMDERFISMQKQMDERFISMQKQMDERFDSMQKQMNERFAASDKRFESVDSRFDDINRHFDYVNKRFEDMARRFDMQFRFTTIGFVMLGAMVTIYRFLG